MKEKTKKKHICICCRKKFTEDKISFSPDPFAEEINGDDKNVWECKSCRYESAMDI